MRDKVNHFNKTVTNMAVKDFFASQKFVQKGVVFAAKCVLRYNSRVQLKCDGTW
jgi:hypothetical protein